MTLFFNFLDKFSVGIRTATLVKGCAIEVTILMVIFSVNLSSFWKIKEISGCHSNNYVKTVISFLFSGKIRYFGGQTVEVEWAAFTKFFKTRLKTSLEL